MSKTRIQTRGVCSVCGSVQALNGITLVPHGFNLHWGFRSGSCSGTHNPHYGHKDAPKFLKGRIESLKEEEKALPERIAKTEERKYKREQEAFLRRIPSIIAGLEERIANWKEADPIEVDIEVEEQELKAKREAEAEKKAEEVAAKKAEKEAKKLEREAKSKEKWNGILATNYHSVEVDKEVVVEWTADYENRDKMEDAHYEAARKYMDEKGITDHYDRMSFVYRITHRVRKETAKGKQLHKF